MVKLILNMGNEYGNEVFLRNHYQYMIDLIDCEEYEKLINLIFQSMYIEDNINICDVSVNDLKSFLEDYIIED